MKKTELRFYIDAFLFISIVGIVLIGFLLGFVLPEGPAASEDSKYFLGLHRHAWGDIHLYLGVAFTVLAALHVILGWNWVKGKARQLFRRGWTARSCGARGTPTAEPPFGGTWMTSIYQRSSLRAPLTEMPGIGFFCMSKALSGLAWIGSRARWVVLTRSTRLRVSWWG